MRKMRKTGIVQVVNHKRRKVDDPGHACTRPRSSLHQGQARLVRDRRSRSPLPLLCPPYRSGGERTKTTGVHEGREGREDDWTV